MDGSRNLCKRFHICRTFVLDRTWRHAYHLVFYDGAVQSDPAQSGLDLAAAKHPAGCGKVLVDCYIIGYLERGWLGTILYLAIMSKIDPTYYEAAKIDGASRLRQIWNITLPNMRSIISLNLILTVSGLLGSNLDQTLVLMNSQNREKQKSSTLMYIVWGCLRVTFRMRQRLDSVSRLCPSFCWLPQTRSRAS